MTTLTTCRASWLLLLLLLAILSLLFQRRPPARPVPVVVPTGPPGDSGRVWFVAGEDPSILYDRAA